MNLDPGVLLQCLLEVFEDGANAVWQTHDIHVVQVGEEVFVRQQEILKREQAPCCPRAYNMGMRASPCSLPSPWWITWVSPQSSVQRYWEGVGIKLEHERKLSVAPTDLLESVQHRCSGDHVKRTNSVNGEHGGTTIQVCERLDGVCHAFSTCLGCQRVLKRRSRLRHCRREKRETPRDQPPNKIPHTRCRTPPPGF